MAAFRLAHWLLSIATLVNVSLTAAAACAGEARVAFDLPAAIECREVTPPEFGIAHPELKVIEGKLRISARLDAGAENQIVDYMYTIVSARQTMRFQDYLPNTLLESKVADDQIEITNSAENCDNAGIEAHVAYKLLNVGGTLGHNSKEAESSHYKQIAAKELVLASGTINREHGVFFRLRPSRAASLEGAKEFTFLATVPKTWRGDLCTISCAARAAKTTFFSSSQAPAGGVEAVVPMHLMGDAEAANRVRAFRQAQAALAAAVRAHEQDSVLTTISSHTVGLFTGGKSKTEVALAAARKNALEAETLLAELAQ